MSWYYVTKKIAGRSYHYRQRTYREGGKVRTESQYVGPIDDAKPNQSNDEITFGNPFAKLEEKSSSGRFSGIVAEAAFQHRKISVVALDAEYERLKRALGNLDIDAISLPKFQIVDGEGGWKRTKSAVEISLNTTKSSSGRTKLKRDFRLALGDTFLDQVKSQRPFLFERLRTYCDHSYFNTKMTVTLAILRSKEAQKFGLTLQFLWSGQLPRSLEKQYAGISLKETGNGFTPHWQIEARELIADILQRGSNGVDARLTKDLKKSKQNARRAFREYQKLGFLERRGKRGKRILKRYKKWETAHLLARQKQSRFSALSLIFDENIWR